MNSPSPPGEGQPREAGQGGEPSPWVLTHNQTDRRVRRHAAFQQARAMRKALTPPEARMWVALKAFRTGGWQFRKQAPFRGYFLDFVCFAAKLAVEVDGRQHSEKAQADHDATRDAVLTREGFVVLRFSNEAVMNELEGVCRMIEAHLVAAVPHPDRLRRPVPPQEGREK